MSVEAKPPEGWKYVPRDDRAAALDLPDPFFNRNKEPDKYDPGEALTAAVNIALLLGQPLLLTGDPGCGKTSLAYWLAHQLGLDEPLVQVVKSTTTGRDLLYRFDELARFRDAQPGGTRRPQHHYLEFEALGRAILFSAGPGGRLRREPGSPMPESEAPYSHADLFRHDFPAAPRQVVLIDELDKAPRDTPNDLLSEIERMEFRIPELSLTVEGSAKHRPVVVITSNSDKSLPEPFLRRCVYHHIPTPTPQRRADIVDKRQPELMKRRELFNDAMATYERLRVGIGARGRPPGTAELLAWLDAVNALYPPGATTLASDERRFLASLSTLAKTREDIELARKVLGLTE